MFGKTFKICSKNSISPSLVSLRKNYFNFEVFGVCREKMPSNLFWCLFAKRFYICFVFIRNKIMQKSHLSNPQVTSLDTKTIEYTLKEFILLKSIDFIEMSVLVVIQNLILLKFHMTLRVSYWVKFIQGKFNIFFNFKLFF